MGRKAGEEKEGDRESGGEKAATEDETPRVTGVRMMNSNERKDLAGIYTSIVALPRGGANPDAAGARDRPRTNSTRGYFRLRRIGGSVICSASGSVFSRRERPGETVREIRGGTMKILIRLWKEEQGQDLVEYALLLVLISMGAVASMRSLASAISDSFSNAGANLTSAT
jgi:pilus assembly protein Flp/PilA